MKKLYFLVIAAMVFGLCSGLLVFLHAAEKKTDKQEFTIEETDNPNVRILYKENSLIWRGKDINRAILFAASAFGNRHIVITPVPYSSGHSFQCIIIQRQN